MTFDLGTMTITDLKRKMLHSAVDATEQYIKDVLDGEDKFACGFAWVTIYPQWKGNTKEGKGERAFYRALGFELDYTGKSFMMWNPSDCGFQNIDCKERGAEAAAEVLRSVGIKAYAGSRLD